MIRIVLPLLFAAPLLTACSSASEDKFGLWVGDMKLCADKLSSVVERTDEGEEAPILHIRMTEEGAQELERMSRAYVRKPLPVVVNNRTIFEPNLFEPLTEGRVQLQGLAPGDRADVIAYAKRPC